MFKLSVAIAVYNEEKNIGKCLSPLTGWASETVVVDGGSIDKTVEIARKLGARVIQTTNPPIFHINKQKALEACQGEWILQLDADEIVSDLLKNEINQVMKNSQAKDGYFIPRKNYFLGHWMRKGGQYPDYVIRLLKKGKGRFPAKSVHEQIAITGSIGKLSVPLEHYSYRSIREYWHKSVNYIKLYAQEMQTEHVSKHWLNWLKYGLIKPNITFWLLFLRHKGFMDGVYGFLFALFSACHHPLAYKYYLTH